MKISQLYTQFTLLKELFLRLAGEKALRDPGPDSSVQAETPLRAGSYGDAPPLRMGAELPKKQESHTSGI